MLGAFSHRYAAKSPAFWKPDQASHRHGTGVLLTLAEPATSESQIIKGSATVVLAMKATNNSDGSQDLDISGEHVLWITSGGKVGETYYGRCKGPGRFDKTHRYSAKFVCTFFLKGPTTYTIGPDNRPWDGEFRIVKETGYAGATGEGSCKYTWVNSSYDRYFYNWEMKLTLP